MTLMHALIILAIAGLIVGVAVFLLTKKKLPLPPLRIRKKPPEMSSQEEVALKELAQKIVSTYPELGSTPAELLSEIDAYCKKAHAPDNTSHLILEKMLMAGNLQKAMSYWQVHAFLDYRDKLKKSRQA
jgi:hypothetical protein